MTSLQGKNTQIQTKIDWLVLLILIFIPRLFSLNVFLTADEPLFLEQAREFAAGLRSGDLSRTLGIGYPGVTLAWWSAPVVGFGPTGDPQAELAAYTAGRTVTVLVTGLLLLLLYALARRLVGPWPALLGVGLLALDPYTLAYSRLLHIAAPLALFMSLAGLTWLLWLDDERWPWLGLTGLFTGLALLTKSTALLLIPMLGLSLAGWVITQGQGRTWGWWQSKIGGPIIIGLIAGLVFFVAWPAMWIEPGRALDLTFGKLFTDQEAGTGNLGLFWLGRFVEDPGLAFYPVAFLLKSTPWLLVGLLLSLGLIWRSSGLRLPFTSHLASRPHVFPATIALWLFALGYLLLMTIASKKSVRYLLPVFPVFYLLAGLAFYQVAAAIRSQAALRSSGILPALIFVPVLLFALVYHPYYFTYYNPLLLGWRWAPQTLLVGWGEGLEQAAHYLAPKSQDTVSAWYEWLFPIFYPGPVEAVAPQENMLTADHTVLYINQVQRDIPGPNIIDYFRTRRQPEHTVRLNGVDYAWVYPGPVAGFRADPIPQHPLDGEFGGEARLLGYDLHPQARSGQPLVVTLYWRVLATPPAERFVFVRLIDAQGHIWAKSDSPPVMGLWPSLRWQAEMLIEDAHELVIPPGTPPDVYRLEVGMYDPQSGQPLPASGRPLGAGGGLLLGEVPVEWSPSTVAPELPWITDVRLAPNARLIGFDQLPALATTGDLLPLRLAWRESKTIRAFLTIPNNYVMFEWRPAQSSQPQPLAEQLDELPWPVEKWGWRARLLSQHELIVPPTLTSGLYDVSVALHTSSDPAGEAVPLASIKVTAPPHRFELPAGIMPPAGAAQLANMISLLGYDFQPVLTNEGQIERLDLQLYWQTSAPISTRYKVFAQLLAADNALVAQSDHFPAGGERPTTGWLPQEIITDAHTLGLPPDLPPGNYHLIAGLYNPVTGERLPRLDDQAQVIADAIFVAEVTLP